MKGYVEFETSTPLGQYYMKCQLTFTVTAYLACSDILLIAIYVNLAIEVKLYLDVSITQGRLDSRDRLLKFYDKIPLHSNFKEVDKTDSKEVKKRYRNQHGTQADQSARILEECFTSIGAPPSKKQTMITSPMTSSGIVASTGIVAPTEIVTSTDIMTSGMLTEEGETAAA
jgi:hypothetical protein